MKRRQDGGTLMQSCSCRQTQQQQIKGRETDRKPGTGPTRPRGIENVVEREKSESCVADGEHLQSKVVPTRNSSLAFQTHADQARREGEDDEEAGDEKCCPSSLGARVKSNPPSEDEQYRAGEGAKQQTRPRAKGDEH